MKKYLGIIKITTESFVGVDIRILTKFSNRKSYIKRWMKLYPHGEKLMLDNNKLLEDFFKDFEDFSPVTEDEKARAQKLYEEFMKQQD